uniref:Transmembrane protein n=1 Tax=Macrostomum lignano TaxID=282301 RepID=A0A1I8J2E5_9PLAT
MAQTKPSSTTEKPQPPQYFGPRIYHEVPDCREVASNADPLSSWLGRQPRCCRCPSFCSTPARLFLSLTGIAVSLALIAAILLIVGGRFSLSASSIAG